MTTKPSASRLLRFLAPLLLFTAATAQDKPEPIRPMEHPYLWEIKTSPPCYLYGTVHVPDDRVLALPEIVTAAIERTDVLYTEISLDMVTQLKVAKATLLPKGQTLEGILPKDLYARLDAFLKTKGMSAYAFGQLKIWAVQSTLVMIDHLQAMVSKEPLDKNLVSRAKALNKQTATLETPEEQISVFEAFTTAEQARMLVDTLDEVEQAAKDGKSPIEELLIAYLKGDLDALFDSLMAQYDEEEELNKKALDLLIWQRNERMVKRIIAKIKGQKDKSHFFAVGVAHYPRPKGILALMRKQGYALERLDASDVARFRPQTVGAGR